MSDVIRIESKAEMQQRERIEKKVAAVALMRIERHAKIKMAAQLMREAKYPNVLSDHIDIVNVGCAYIADEIEVLLKSDS
ncbi:hypothetical protein LCGC14_1240110 [marine sediment metagenome]|uniref:Uncharacterized protein n=1 Tax=marine sediment metagenome TaxID=412755 RepID=A0A0F9NNA0_9ZZZZ